MYTYIYIYTTKPFEVISSQSLASSHKDQSHFSFRVLRMYNTYLRISFTNIIYLSVITDNIFINYFFSTID